jgi:ABC-type lipoprotein release transport system permease subunit
VTPRPFRGSLRHSRLQAILAVVAIGAAVSLPVVLVSVGGGVSAHELAQIETAGYQVVVSAPGTHGIAHAHAVARAIDGVAQVTAASPVLSVAIDAFPGSGGPQAVLAEGIIPDQFTPTLGPAESGLFPDPLPLGDPTDAVHYANGTYDGPATYDVLVSTPYESIFGVGPGDRLLLGPDTNRSQALAYNVTGTFGVPLNLLGPTGAFAILLPLSDLQVMTGYGPAATASVPDAADSVEVAVASSITTDPTAIAHVQAEVQALYPLYGVSALSQQATQLENASAVLTGFYLALSSVGITVGLLFLALVLLRRVEADRRSIGVRRAIGVPGRSIAAGVLGDGLVLAASGTLLGIAAGVVLVEALATWATGAVQEAAQLAVFAPAFLALLTAGMLALSLLASGIASRAALRLEIAEALR